MEPVGSLCAQNQRPSLLPGRRQPAVEKRLHNALQRYVRCERQPAASSQQPAQVKGVLLHCHSLSRGISYPLRAWGG
jgi:hypothetical protein